MTREEFDLTNWRPRMIARYNKKDWIVASCDFGLRTIGLVPTDNRYTVPLEKNYWEVMLTGGIAEPLEIEL